MIDNALLWLRVGGRHARVAVFDNGRQQNWIPCTSRIYSPELRDMLAREHGKLVAILRPLDALR